MKVQMLLLIVVVAMLVAACGDSKSGATVQGDSFVIPASEVGDGLAHYYQLQAGGKEVNFFVLKSNDGTLRAAFDACDVCYESRKGYSQDGEFMVCNNCGRRFHSSRINEVEGGCNPAPLNRVMEGGNLRIALSDIAQGAFYF